MTSRKTEIARSRGEFPENKRNEHDEERAVDWDEEAEGAFHKRAPIDVGEHQRVQAIRYGRPWQEHVPARSRHLIREES